MKVLVQECNLDKDNTKDLPVHAYVVEYVKEDQTKHDIVLTGHNGTVGIFDHYWDLYKEGLKGWNQANGMVPVRQWKSTQEVKDEQSKKKNKKKRT